MIRERINGHDYDVERDADGKIIRQVCRDTKPITVPRFTNAELQREGELGALASSQWGDREFADALKILLRRRR